MNIFFSDLAQKELQDAVAYYDEISSTLGDDLINEVKLAEHLVSTFPFAWTSIGNHQRKYVLKRFPYMIIYKVYGDRIVVSAFAHQHQNPEHFIKR